jgi:hypothetical protein
MRWVDNKNNGAKTYLQRLHTTIISTKRLNYQAINQQTASIKQA